MDHLRLGLYETENLRKSLMWWKNEILIKEDDIFMQQIRAGNNTSEYDVALNEPTIVKCVGMKNESCVSLLLLFCH